jgi:Mitochondrial carrier protein
MYDDPGRDVPFSFLFFPSVAILKEQFAGNTTPAPLFATFASGVVAGAISSALVTPMDVVKTRLQATNSPYTSMTHCYSQIIKTEGPKALFNGVVPRMLIVSPLFAISLLVYEFQKRIFST